MMENHAFIRNSIQRIAVRLCVTMRVVNLISGGRICKFLHTRDTDTFINASRNPWLNFQYGYFNTTPVYARLAWRMAWIEAACCQEAYLQKGQPIIEWKQMPA